MKNDIKSLRQSRKCQQCDNNKNNILCCVDEQLHCCASQCFTKRHYNALHCTHYTTSHCTAQYYSALHRTELHETHHNATRYYDALNNSTQHFTIALYTTQHNTTHHLPMCCSIYDHRPYRTSQSKTILISIIKAFLSLQRALTSNR